MAELRIEGDELKKLVKLGKTRPMPFAFCPGGSDDENVLVIHRKKTPEMLGKAARKEGDGSKVAFGTFEVEAKLMTLTCLREIPDLAKKLKKHMKAQRLLMKVRILNVADLASAARG